MSEDNDLERRLGALEDGTVVDPPPAPDWFEYWYQDYADEWVRGEWARTVEAAGEQNADPDEVAYLRALKRKEGDL